MTTIAIFGISGRTGQALADGARARGWGTRSLGRISSTAPIGAAMIHGGFDQPQRVQEAVRDVVAACCVFGPRPPFTDVFCAEASRAVIAAMRAAGCRRLLCVTGAMVGEVPSRSRGMHWMTRAFGWRRPAVAADRLEQETVVMASGLDWTIIKPPRLTEGDPTGRIVAGTNLPVDLRSTLTRADLARFMLDAVADAMFVNQRVLVKNVR
jgi:putative NADH-flavin reductase